MATEKSEQADPEAMTGQTPKDAPEADTPPVDAPDPSPEPEPAPGDAGTPEPPDEAQAADRVDPWASRAESLDPEPDPQTPPPAPLAAAPHDEMSHDEDQGSSFAAKALTFLVILLGGAALGIWGAPKIAPMLPAGMAPVAAWLSPGQSDAEARIAALEAQIADVGARVPASADIEAAAQGLVTAAEERLTGQIAAVSESLGETDMAAVATRVGEIETALDGTMAELASLTAQIASGSVGGAGDAAVAIDTYRAELDGLRAEVQQLSGTVSGLGGRLDEAVAAAETRVAEAEEQASSVQEAAAAERDQSAIEADLAMIQASLVSGEPFAETLSNLAAKLGTAPPEGLAAAAPSGVATSAALRSGFGDAAHEAIRASILASAGEGLLARSTAYLQAQVASRSLEPQTGSSPDAVLSRIEDALRRDDLGAAVAEAEALPSEASEALSGWLEAARTRAEAEAGLAEMSAAASAQN